MKKIFIFGNNYLSEILWYYLQQEGNRVEGFVLNEKYVSLNTYSLPADLYSVENVVNKYGAKNICVYLTIGNTQMNAVREKVYNGLKKNGVEIRTYIHPSACIAKNVQIEEGSIILENVILQPYVRLGKCNIVWQGVNISHHCIIGNYNYFAPSVTVAGCCKIENKSFFGVNSTLVDHVNVGDSCFLAAGVCVTHNMKEDAAISFNGHSCVNKSGTEKCRLYEQRNK